MNAFYILHYLFLIVELRTDRSIRLHERRLPTLSRQLIQLFIVDECLIMRDKQEDRVIALTYVGSEFFQFEQSHLSATSYGILRQQMCIRVKRAEERIERDWATLTSPRWMEKPRRNQLQQCLECPIRITARKTREVRFDDR